jgi:hypothetical protein
MTLGAQCGVPEKAEDVLEGIWRNRSADYHQVNLSPFFETSLGHDVRSIDAATLPRI